MLCNVERSPTPHLRWHVYWCGIHHIGTCVWAARSLQTHMPTNNAKQRDDCSSRMTPNHQPPGRIARSAQDTRKPPGRMARSAQDTRKPPGRMARSAQDTRKPPGRMARSAQDTRKPPGRMARSAQDSRKPLSPCSSTKWMVAVWRGQSCAIPYAYSNIPSMWFCRTSPLSSFSRSVTRRSSSSAPYDVTSDVWDTGRGPPLCTASKISSRVPIWRQVSTRERATSASLVTVCHPTHNTTFRSGTQSRSCRLL
jgi:hypothetical protein